MNVDPEVIKAETEIHLAVRSHTFHWPTDTIQTLIQKAVEEVIQRRIKDIMKKPF
jgi:hypothetical protein